MAAPTNLYVDPSIAGNSGTGTIGDPFGDCQYALDRQGIDYTRDATNGNQFNVKTGTDEILAAILSYVTYGTPTNSAPVIWRGYTSAANDGGIGGMDGNAGNFSINSTGATHFVDMHLHNTGTATLVGSMSSIQNCELDTSTGGVNSSFVRLVQSCNIHNVGGTTLMNVFAAHFNWIDNTETNKFTNGITSSAAQGTFQGNILILPAATTAIAIGIGHDRVTVSNNNVLGAASTGHGIEITSEVNGLIVINNLISGMSGTSGVGIDGVSRAEGYELYGNNGVHDCATNYDRDADVIFDVGDNESLSSSPFALSGANTYANRNTYFAPANVGNVLGGGYGLGNIDKGAVQSAVSVRLINGGLIA